MSDANSVALRYVQESTFGTTPATPTMKNLRMTGESLKQDTNTVRSAEIRADRQISDIVRVGLSASGAINFELSCTTYDDFLKSLLLSSGWSTPVTTTLTNITFAAGSSQYTLTRASGSFVTDGFVANQWVKITGAGTAGNNGYAKLLTVTATVLTVEYNGNGVNEASGASVTINMGAQIVNGTTFSSYAIERENTDLSNEFTIFNGMAIDQASLNVSADALLSGSFSFMGKKETSATATAASTTTAATTTGILNAIDHVTAVKENGIQYDVTALTMQLQNNLRARLQVGTLGAISIGKGTINLTGSHQAYYASKTIMDKYLNATRSSLFYLLNDGTNQYIFEYPTIKYTDGQRVAGGVNTDIIADMKFEAFADATENITIRIVRW